MNFAEFLAWQGHVRREQPDVVPICETRIAHAFATMRSQLGSAASKVHRCDLAREWCRVRGFPETIAARALVSRGVRHSLAIFFAYLARESATIALPSDVYPVYRALADAAGAHTVRVRTFPELELDRVLGMEADHVLLPYPLKLHGRAWTSAEIARATAWLAERRERRLWLDGVYSFGLPLDGSLTGLLATDQVVYLDSLSKGWLHEQVFGVAVVPEQDLARYKPVFRDEATQPDDLTKARVLLTREADLPGRVVAAINGGREALQTQLAQRGVPLIGAQRGYLVRVALNAETLLARHGLLAIPASAFGADAPGLSIASALPANDAP